MEYRLQQYFRAEKKSALFLLLFGIFTFAIGYYFLFYTTDELLNGMAYPLLIFAVLFVIGGATVYFRTKQQVQQLLQQMKTQPRPFVAAENKRMAKVIHNFRNLKIAEQSLFFLGFILLLVGSLGKVGLFMVGTGMGLMVQSAVALAVDLFADMRAVFYQMEIKKFGEEN